MSSPIHPLHRATLMVMIVGAALGTLCFALSFHPPTIDHITVQCAFAPQPQGFRSMFNEKPDAQEHTPTPSKYKWRAISWDLAGAGPPRYPESSGRDRWKRDAHLIIDMLDSTTLSSTESPRVIAIQGVTREVRQLLTGYLRSRGGCWASAPLWETPPWVSWLKRQGVDLYRSIWGPHHDNLRDLIDHDLWIGVQGLPPTARLRAERWALPQVPGRWPSRWFNQRPAALMLEVRDRGETLRLLNLKLPDAVHKHQGGGLALRELQRSPLKMRLGDHWMIMGDWRVTPPDTPAHSQVEFRFQRFSIAAIYQGRFGAHMYPPRGATAQEWGRWRLSGHSDPQQEPAIIDHVLVSHGALRGLSLPPSRLPWIGSVEQRAPLGVEWSTEP